MAGVFQGIRMRIEIRVLLHQVMEDIELYSDKFHRRLGPLIRQQMRLLIRACIKLTPPRSGAWKRESFAEQLRIGRNAVSRDVQRVFVPIDKIALKSHTFGKPIMTALKENNLAGQPGRGNSLPELLVKVGAMDIPDPGKILDAPSKQIHDRFRVQGKVRGRLPWPYFVKTTAALRAFIKVTADDVGKGKGGWGAGAQAFKVSVPGWIAKHFSGEVIDQTGNKEHPYAIVRNTVSYINSQNVDAAIVKQALEARHQALTRQMEALAAEKIKL